MNIHILSNYIARISNLNPLILKKFLFSGLLVTLLSYLSFPLIFYYFNEAYFNLSYLISAIINISLSFFLQKFYVFKSNNKISKEYFRFLLNTICITFIYYIFLYLMVKYFLLNFILSNSILTTLAALSSYLVHSKFTFKENRINS